jgi:uncharacterized SAM-binding protein YcdF (DUF218 family)
MVSRRGNRLVGFLLTLALIAWLFCLAAVVVVGRRDDLAKADAIIVLGAAQYDGRPSPVFKSRLDHAAHLFNSGYAPLLILTGGPGEGDRTTEADVGRKYMLSKGIAEVAILVENEGRSSSESLRTAAAMLKARNLESAILVSDSFHMLRLRILAARHGLRPRTSPAPDSPIAANPSRAWRYILSESIKAPLAFLLERS